MRDDGNHRYELKMEVCKSEHQHIWMGILYAIKTSLLVCAARVHLLVTSSASLSV